MKDPGGCLELAQRLCGQFSIECLRPQIDTCLELLERPGGVDVVISGPFNAGKRSFLNFMLGKALLPVDAMPAEGVAIRLRFGFRDRARVRRQDGGDEAIPLGQLRSVITEEGNPGNAAKVACVDVDTPAMAGWRGLRFVCLPESWSAPDPDGSRVGPPPAGPLFLAFPMDHRLDEEILDRLAGTLARAPGAVLLLTKADLLEEGAREKEIELLRDQLSGRMGVRAPLLLFSTHEGFGPLQRELRAFLVRAKGDHPDLFEEALEPEIQALMGGLKDYLLLADRTARAAEEIRMDLRRRVQVARIRLRTLERELQLRAGQIKARARSAADMHFRSHAPELTRQVQSAYHRDLPGRGGEPDRQAGIFHAWLAETLALKLRPLSETGRQPLEPFLEGAETLAVQTARTLKDGLAGEIRKVMGLRFRGSRFVAPRITPTTPELQVPRWPETQLERLGAIVAVDLLQPMMERHFLNLIQRQAEANLARLAGLWAESVDGAIDALAGSTTAFMERELATLESLLSDAPARQAEIEAALAELDAMG
ncbi:MAG TPA: hypothetical protein VJ483_01155 [Holophagaceae bacterium]|nr:hypothetical protein [Holophagaceae bacterium]